MRFTRDRSPQTGDLAPEEQGLPMEARMDHNPMFTVSSDFRRQENHHQQHHVTRTSRGRRLLHRCPLNNCCSGAETQHNSETVIPSGVLPKNITSNAGCELTPDQYHRDSLFNHASSSSSSPMSAEEKHNNYSTSPYLLQASPALNSSTPVSLTTAAGNNRLLLRRGDNPATGNVNQPPSHPTQYASNDVPMLFRNKAIEYMLSQLQVETGEDVHSSKVFQCVLHLEEQIFIHTNSRQEYVTQLAIKLGAILHNLDQYLHERPKAAQQHYAQQTTTRSSTTTSNTTSTSQPSVLNQQQQVRFPHCPQQSSYVYVQGSPNNNT